jgi:CPA2 family monovalent cation:H+ antiporter-2
MMELDGWRFLGELLLLLGGAVALGAALEAIGVSAVIGYLLAGVILGPGLTGLVGDVGPFEVVAELGVALLLFSIGLEMTPAKLRGFGVRGAVVGFLQIVITAVTAGIAAWLFDTGLRGSIVAGTMVAMSSTAVVVRLLVDRGEIDSPRGREALSILLAQDVAVVPILILVGILGSMGGEDAPATAADAASQAAGQIANAAVGLLVVVLGLAIVGVFVLPRLLGTAVFRRNRDFAIVIAIITCMVAAWGSHMLHLSPALGAFVAGLVLARVSFSRQIRADTGALRAVFLTLFFASVGLLAQVGELLEPSMIRLVATILGIGLAIKIVATFLAIRLTGGPRTVAIAAALCLAQFGEFSFVVGSEARMLGVIREDTFQGLVGASLLSLLATPLLVARSRSIALRLDRTLVAMKLWKPVVHVEDERAEGMRGHVVVIGFGPAGEEAARTVRLAGYDPYILEMNPASVDRARADGIMAEIGDGTNREILEHMHAADAAAFIVTVPDPEAAIATIHQIRTINRDAVLVARGRYARRTDEMVAAGADHVVNEESTVGTLLGATVVSRQTGVRAGGGEESWPKPRH